MRSLLRYLIKNYAFLLFLFLEVVSLVFVFNNGEYQRVQYLNSSNRVTASVYNTFNGIVQYFELAKVNKSLAMENARLKTMLQPDYMEELSDSVLQSFVQADSTFNYISARVINNSVNKIHNYFTIDKGSNDGIRPDQGIVAPEGIVGVVVSVSESYALGFSVLNNRWGPSGKLKNSGFFGPVEWDGDEYQMASLKEIPFHVKLEVGDTIVTSGYSSFFPEGIIIGTIDSYDQPEGESFYKIKVKLSVDFKSIHFVNVIENINREELNEIEELMEDGETNN